MLSSGDWGTARLDGVTYLEKAPLIYWLMTSATRNSLSPGTPLLPGIRSRTEHAFRTSNTSSGHSNLHVVKENGGNSLLSNQPLP